jgi:ABC-2 type transport system ATP-binding protein
MTLATEAAAGHNVIDARGLTRKFGNKTAVNGLDLTVVRGTIHGFLGPNGCGKTTAIRMLTGLLTPTSGTATVLGRQVPRDAEELKYHIGYMTQAFSLYGDMSVQENLQFFSKIFGLSRKQEKARIEELLSTYYLEDLAAQRSGSMSGGQRQRLALAAAVLHKPDLLFLDEPTSAVDPESRRDFWEQLFDLCETGTTIVVTTHFMDEAERCHNISIMELGHKRAEGSPTQLMEEIGSNVLEVEGSDLRTLRKTLTAMPEVRSAAQLGARLRVLVQKNVEDPEAWFRSLPDIQSVGSVRKVRPNLEDVFVTNTGAQQPSGGGMHDHTEVRP